MKKILLAIPAILALSSCAGISKDAELPNEVPQEEPFVDPTHYEEKKVIAYDQMAVVEPKAEDEIVIPNKVIFKYHNDDKQTESRRFYTWVTGEEGVERMPDTKDATDMTITLDFSVITSYAGMPEIFLIIKKAGTWSGQSADTKIPYKDYQDCIDSDGVLRLWFIPGEGNSLEICKSEEETRIPKIQTAKFMDWKTIHCVSSVDVDPVTGAKKYWVPSYYKVYAFDRSYLASSQTYQVSHKESYLIKQSTNITTTEFDITFNHTCSINVQYMIESKFPGFEDKAVRICFASFEYLYDTTAFNTHFTYEGNDLGATYATNKTTFKLWSPISALVKVNLYDTGVPTSLDKDKGGNVPARSTTMAYTGHGVWEVEILGNLAGKFYTYSVTNPNGSDLEAMDPYAKACGTNGVRGYIYDKTSSEANPEGWNNVSYTKISNPQDLSVYEIHIRDLTMDETWVSNKGNARGGYNAFCESGTTYSETFGGQNYTVKTGYDHIEELGVKAIQILPVFDHDDDEREGKMKFNWGYNPLNYNCVEGGYSSNPADPLVRIKEYKNLIMQYSKNANNTRVIMDVVYNHVSSAASSCFTTIMPKYYFRYDANWNYEDGSGCSNEVRSEAKMMRKYIVDSLCWWASEYKVKGFRFDLMGLIDVDTLAMARRELDKIDTSIVMYGEGWASIEGYHGKGVAGGFTGDVYTYLSDVGTNHTVVGAFNDTGRNAVRGGNDAGWGSNNSYPSWGFFNSDTDGALSGEKGEAIRDMLLGYHRGTGGNPNQMVAYVSCHDNYTCFDQMTYTLATAGYGSYGEKPARPNKTGRPDTASVVSATIAAHSVALLSNGIRFMQGGEEIYRTKTISGHDMPEISVKKTPEYADLTDGISTHSADAKVRPFPDYVTYDPEFKEITSTGEVRWFNDDEFLSHNSYKLPDSINSFKWDRKIHIGDYKTYDYISTWSTLVKAGNNTKKYQGSSAPWAALGETFWYGDNGATTGIFLPYKTSGGMHLVYTARSGGTIGIGTGKTFVIKSRDVKKYEGGNLTMHGYSAYGWEA